MNRRFVQGVLSAFVVHKTDSFLLFLPKDAFSEPFPQYCSPSCSDKTWRTCASQATLIASSPTAFVPDGVHVHFADKECIAIDHQAKNTADFYVRGRSPCFRCIRFDTAKRGKVGHHEGYLFESMLSGRRFVQRPPHLGVGEEDGAPCVKAVDNAVPILLPVAPVPSSCSFCLNIRKVPTDRSDPAP